MPFEHAFGAVSTPAEAQLLESQVLPSTQGSPLSGPPRQRFPPQIPGVPIGFSGQSASVMHGSALALLHTSQKHLRDSNPNARQSGLAALAMRSAGPSSPAA